MARVNSPAGEEMGRWRIAEQQLCFEFAGEAPRLLALGRVHARRPAIAANHSDGRAVLVTLEQATAGD